MNFATRYLPWIILTLVMFGLILAMLPARERDDQMQLSKLGQLPVLDNGRVKPLDTLARTSLMLISNRTSYRDENGREQEPIKWLMDVMSGNNNVTKARIFRIENDQVLALLGLEG